MTERAPAAWRERQLLLRCDRPEDLDRWPTEERARREMLRRPAQALQAMPVEGGEIAAPPPPVRMSGIYATEEPYLKLFLGRDDDGYRALRFTLCRLDLGAGMVVAPGLGTPAGVMLTYEHLTFLPSLGKVETMAIEARQLRGEYVVSPAELALWYAGGVADMEAGLHSGLSIGFSALQEPVYERRAGTRYDPDRLRWRKIELVEVAVTDLPALASAGRTGTVREEDTAGDGDKPPTEGEGNE